MKSFQQIENDYGNPIAMDSHSSIERDHSESVISTDLLVTNGKDKQRAKQIVE